MSVAAPTAHAAFPGENGKIVFQTNRDGNELAGNEIYIMNADGSGQTNLTNSPSDDKSPAWSPDGTRIAFVSDRADPNTTNCQASCNFEVYTMNADGTGVFRVTHGEYFAGVHSGDRPAWSPDGLKIAFQRGQMIHVINADGTGEYAVTPGIMPTWSPNGEKIALNYGGGNVNQKIYTVNPDGSNRTLLTPCCYNFAPDWSPDGSKILWDRDGDFYTMNADGTAQTFLADPGSGQPGTNDRNAVWSPDASRIAFQSNRDNEYSFEIYVMYRDGTGITRLTTNGTRVSPLVHNTLPDWQPILRGYPRPQAAALFRVPLAIAYDECPSAAANRTHGPALTASSCNPATPASDHLTIGTLDANAKSTQAIGRVKYVACATGTTASGECSTPPGMSSPDVRVEAALNDVRSKSDLSDYSGELEVTQTLRITDKQNTPAPPNGTSGTVTDLPLSYTVPCTPTQGPADAGSTCSVLTRMNALIPGSVVAGKRSNWEISQVEVSDGGPDGLVPTPDNTVFAREGIFIP